MGQQEYEFDEEFAEQQGNAEILISTKAGVGVRLRWFRMDR